MERESRDGQWTGKVLRGYGNLCSARRLEPDAGGCDKLARRAVESDYNSPSRTNDVGELREHEGGRGDKIGCLGYGGEKLGEAFSAELRAGGYRCALTLRVVQVAA